jgi:hypothetical protein
MSRCIDYCITVSGTTLEEIWQEVSIVTGPVPSGAQDCIDLMNTEIAEYNVWTAENKLVPFDKWLIWKRRVGTKDYGNLPADKKRLDKVGHIYAPCPYSTQSSDFKTTRLLGLTEGESLPTKVDHSVGGVTYYMKTASRGSKWGYECTFPGCPHYILTGQHYFFT